MMPKLWASHTGHFWMIAMVASGLLLCGLAHAQTGPLGNFDDTMLKDTSEDAGSAMALLRLRNFRATATFADDDSDIDTPLVALTWTNPPDSIINVEIGGQPAYQLTLYRSTNGYPTGPLDGNRIPLPPDSDAYLDRDVLEGVTYYYTLIGDIPDIDSLPQSVLDQYPERLIGEFPQVRHAYVTAGEKVPNILTESFGFDPILGEQAPFDLAYSQITIRPVGPPLAPLGEEPKGVNYNAYEATVARDVTRLPVESRDALGGSISLTPMGADRLLALPLGNMRFPFFGKQYDTIYLSSNGYIVFEDLLEEWDDDMVSLIDLLGLEEEDFDLLEVLNSPNLAGHFLAPRISFLFSFLSFEIGGDAWARMLPDRVVITYKKVPEIFYDPFVSPGYNTVQVELFFSGKIRITYLDASINLGVVGISDGRGAPVDPTQVFDDVEPAYSLTDFQFLPEFPSQLSINPVAPPQVKVDDIAEFDVTALVPEGLGIPVFTGEWTNDGPPPLGDIGGAGRFYWQTTYEDRGVHTVRVETQLSGMRAYQDVRVIVREMLTKPTAVELLLSTNTPDEDPSADRPISSERPLIASYTYYHPHLKESPWLYEEFFSLIYWFRNDQVVSSLTNTRVVPAHVPQPGDTWRFQVVPITVLLDFGLPANSPVVSVVDIPEIESIIPAKGLTVGGETVIIRGRHLGNFLSVTFNDVAADRVALVSRDELSVVTPLHPAGPATVSVKTIGGIGRKVNAFTFVGDKDDELVTDDDEEAKERSILGCGGSHPASHRGDGLLLAGLVALLLAKTARRQQLSA